MRFCIVIVILQYAGWLRLRVDRLETNRPRKTLTGRYSKNSFFLLNDYLLKKSIPNSILLKETDKTLRILSAKNKSKFVEHF